MREFIRFIRNPTTEKSNKWFEWVAVITLTTCIRCINLNGTVRDENWEIKPPLHPNCNCFIIKMLSILAGTLTNLGTNGVDWYIKYKKNYLITTYLKQMLKKRAG